MILLLLWSSLPAPGSLWFPGEFSCTQQESKCIIAATLDAVVPCVLVDLGAVVPSHSVYTRAASASSVTVQSGYPCPFCLHLWQRPFGFGAYGCLGACGAVFLVAIAAITCSKWLFSDAAKVATSPATADTFASRLSSPLSFCLHHSHISVLSFFNFVTCSFMSFHWSEASKPTAHVAFPVAAMLASCASSHGGSSVNSNPSAAARLAGWLAADCLFKNSGAATKSRVVSTANSNSVRSIKTAH